MAERPYRLFNLQWIAPAQVNNLPPIPDLTIQPAETPRPRKTKTRNVALLSDLITDNPDIACFWTLETHVSRAARMKPQALRTPLTCDIAPEFRTTPPKWEQILTAAYERGLRAA